MSSLLDRISINPNVCHGQPCVKGTRIMVWLILEYLANGSTFEEILDAYPTLACDDIQACLAYGAEASRDEWDATIGLLNDPGARRDVEEGREQALRSEGRSWREIEKDVRAVKNR